MADITSIRMADETSLRVRSVALNWLTDSDLAGWYNLLERSCEPNPFLSPDFVLPLIQHLNADAPVMMFVVESSVTGQWMAAGVFEIKAHSRLWPLKYARGLSSPYSFLDGMLIDQREGAAALTAILQSQSRRRDWHGLHFGAIRKNSELSRLLDTAGVNTDLSVYRCRDWFRACFLNRGPRTTEDILADCSKSRRKSLRRCRKRLESEGEISYRLVTPDSGSAPAVNTFLRLEQLGWKGAEGTAIACQPDHEAFFRDMIHGFARRDAVLFGELLVGGDPVASTCNLRSGPLLSAFKIGWDPAYAEGGVGLWSEVELAAAISQQHPRITRIDSSAQFGSYVESVWHDRVPMISLNCTWSHRGLALQYAGKYLKLLRSLASPA